MRLVVIGLAPPSWTHVVDQLLYWRPWNELACSEAISMALLLCRVFMAAPYTSTRSLNSCHSSQWAACWFFFFSGNELLFLRNYNHFLEVSILLEKIFISKESFAKQSLNQIASFSITLNWNNFPWLSQLGWRFSESLWIWEEVPFHPTRWEGSLCSLIELPVLEMGKLRPGACHPTFIEQDYVYTYTHTHLHKYLSVSLCAYSHILKSSLKERR